MKPQNNIHYAKLIEYYDSKSRIMKIPFSGTLELTPRCNMNCKMCYIRMNEDEMKNVGQELPAEEWIRIAQEAADAGMIMVLLTGGEAILHKDFKKIYLALKKMGIFVSINSNGTMLQGEWMEFFKQNPPAKFNITIYGSCNETYARLCGNPYGFDQLKSAIEELQANNIDILLNCCITKQNVDDLDGIFAFAKNHNLPIHATTYSFPPVRKEGISCPKINRFTAKEAAQARINLNLHSMGEENALLKFRKTCKDLKDFEPSDECNLKIEGEKVLCAAGRSSFWVTWDGRMLPCGMIPDYSIPITNTSFSDAWKQITSYIDTITLASDCAKCPKNNICLPCAAKLKAETNCYDKKSDYLCEYTDEYIRLMNEKIN